MVVLVQKAMNETAHAINRQHHLTPEMKEARINKLKECANQIVAFEIPANFGRRRNPIQDLDRLICDLDAVDAKDLTAVEHHFVRDLRYSLCELRKRVEPKKQEDSEAHRMTLRDSFRQKWVRAVSVATRLYQGVAQGAKAMRNIYHPELIDSAHRYARDLHDYWLVWKHTMCVTSDFNAWFEGIEQGEDLPGREILEDFGLIEGLPNLRRVFYMNEGDRVEYRLRVDGSGLLRTNADGLLHTFDSKSHPHIVVLGPDGKLYSGVYLAGSMNHSSFFGGEPLLFAGRMLIKEGRLVELSDFTGHYGSNPQMAKNGIEALEALGVDLSDVRITINTHPAAREPKQTFQGVEEWRKSPPMD